MNNTLTIHRPDDWHLHVRDGNMLSVVVPHTAAQFARAIIMPNLLPPITTVQQALAYRQRILNACPPKYVFNPLMTLYLTEQTPVQEVKNTAQNKHMIGFKLYPAGATTNAEAGVLNIEKIYPTLEFMEKHSVPLLVHGEVTDPDVDIFDREAVFIDRVLDPIRRHFGALRIVLEHITTQDAVAYLESEKGPIGATITAHHLLFNRNALLAGGLRPHHYCLPVLKREQHRQALLQAATSGNPKFFLGTDSAPHVRTHKEAPSCCAGCYTALHAMPLYVQAFEEHEALDKLEGFASHHGADFYGLPRNTETLTFTRTPWAVPEAIEVKGNDTLRPLCAGEHLPWSLAA